MRIRFFSSGILKMFWNPPPIMLYDLYCSAGGLNFRLCRLAASVHTDGQWVQDIAVANGYITSDDTSDL